MATITTGGQPITTGHLRIRIHPVWHVLVGIFWVAILVGIIGGFFLHWTWTGFPENGKLWDWLQLLSAPVFVSALPLIFRGQWGQADHKTVEQQSQADAGMAAQQAQSDFKVEEDRQQASALQAYEDYILQLLLDRNLRESQSGSDVQEAARARTLAVLRRIGKNRKGDVLQFLHEAGLIYKGKAIVDLREADLSGADLSDAKLNGIELSGVNLSGAWLTRTALNGANLSNAELSGADLIGADLSEANLTGANFSNAALHGTNFRGATYTEEQLRSAQPYNQGAKS